MAEIGSNKRIAKNTMLLYFRMMFVMAVTIYTSRVILEALGVQDYGIYQVVGGIVGFMSFLQSALSTGTSRFLTFEMGKDNFNVLRKTFSTTLTVHILLAVVIFIIAETVGLWFLYHKLIIPEDRLFAASVVYHISILTAMVSITQTPYSACIIAHEKMSIYAYASICTTILNLGIVYLLIIVGYDKLIFYAVMSFLLNCAACLYYRYYCVKHFPESRYDFSFDKSIFKPIASFSGWSLFANCAIALNSQGVLILLNMFFSPAVVAARAISLQINGAVMQFVNNYRTAANPQIVKRYSSGDTDGSKSLLLSSTKFSYFLLLTLSLPVFLQAFSITHIWLVEVPDYTIIFLRLVLVQSLFQVFDNSLYMALYTKGQLRENAIISPLIGFIQFPVVYLLFKFGCSPVALSWASIATYFILGFIIKPIMLVKIADYKVRPIFDMFWSCLKVTVIIVPIPCILNYYLTFNNFLSIVIITLVSVTISLAAIYYVGIDAHYRNMVKNFLRQKLSIATRRAFCRH